MESVMVPLDTALLSSYRLSTITQITVSEMTNNAGLKKNIFLNKKSPTQWFLGVLGFLDKQEKIGKIIKKTQ